MSIKTSRFADANFDKKQLPPVYGYLNYPLVSLERALQPISPLINQLDRYIKVAKKNCTFPSNTGLTCDESAALFLYTMEWGKESFYRILNKALRSEDRSSLIPWFSFLKLLLTALGKLPTLKKVIWRGVRQDITNELKDIEELTWWTVNSCSSSIHVAKNFLDRNSTLVLIEAANGKNVSEFTNYPNEDEVLLGPGTRLRVVCKTLDHIGGLPVVHLQEITADNDGELSSRRSPINEKLRTRNIIDMAYAKLITSLNHLKLPKTIQNTISSQDDDLKQNEAKTCVSYPNGDRYVGSMKGDKKHGQGTYYYNNGDIYIGEWCNNIINGQGKFTWAVGNTYEGSYKDGKMHGPGIFCFDNGEKYVGEWADNMRNGRGIYSWANGDYYEGDHKNNAFHGRGKQVFGYGHVRKGNWKNNVFIDKDF